jgi:hypothetical protein
MPLKDPIKKEKNMIRKVLFKKIRIKEKKLLNFGHKIIEKRTYTKKF